MSVEGALRSLLRSEIQAQLQPLQQAVVALQARTADLEALSELAHQLSPLTSLLAPFAGPAPVRTVGAGSTRTVGGRGGRGRRGQGANARGCAIIDCGRPARTKGYCAAHYQKLRMLSRTNRLPTTWVDFAAPNSVPDLVLPRGRAASKALKAGKAT